MKKKKLSQKQTQKLKELKKQPNHFSSNLKSCYTKGNVMTLIFPLMIKITISTILMATFKEYNLKGTASIMSCKEKANMEIKPSTLYICTTESIV